MRDNFTKLEVDKKTLALLNEYKSKEAGRRGKGGMTHEAFLHFLLELYKAVGNDDLVLGIARKKVEESKLKRKI